jgi:hypothetical protein
VFSVWPVFFVLSSRSGVLPSLDDSESGARARLAFRISNEAFFDPLPRPVAIRARLMRTFVRIERRRRWRRQPEGRGHRRVIPLHHPHPSWRPPFLGALAPSSPSVNPNPAHPSSLRPERSEICLAFQFPILEASRGLEKRLYLDE